MDDDVTVSVRLDNDVMLKLAMLAHDVNVTLNDLMVHALEAGAAEWQLRRRTSRNAREGRYVGKIGGRHLRSNSTYCYYYGRPDNCVAWLVAAKRAGGPLPVRRPRYLAKGLRDG